MGWGEAHQPALDLRTRADLARELDVALHGAQTIRQPVTAEAWCELLAEVAQPSPVHAAGCALVDALDEQAAASMAWSTSYDVRVAPTQDEINALGQRQRDADAMVRAATDDLRKAVHR